MNSSSSTVSDFGLKMLLSLVIQERLHIVSLEFTEMREKDCETLLHVEIVLREAEQSDTGTLEKMKSIGKIIKDNP